jgi:hypothetical protein
MDLTWSVIVKEYSEVCLKAYMDETVFSTFRRDPVFTQVMEFHYQEYGQKCLDIIKRDNPGLIKYFNKFKLAEKYGSPLVYEYEGILISPSTLRYVKVLSDLMKYFHNLHGFKIAEIGGGYGGLCKVIKDVFDVDYHFIDLPEVNLLAKKFLKKSGIYDVRFSTWDKLVKEGYYLVISVGAFTEMNREIQDHYNEMIISVSNRGYMIGSVELNPNNCYQIEDLKKFGNVVFMPEEPNTHPTNFIMYWNVEN